MTEKPKLSDIVRRFNTERLDGAFDEPELDESSRLETGMDLPFGLTSVLADLKDLTAGSIDDIVSFREESKPRVDRERVSALEKSYKRRDYLLAGATITSLTAAILLGGTWGGIAAGLMGIGYAFYKTSRHDRFVNEVYALDPVYGEQLSKGRRKVTETTMLVAMVFMSAMGVKRSGVMDTRPKSERISVVQSAAAETSPKAGQRPQDMDFHELINEANKKGDTKRARELIRQDSEFTTAKSIIEMLVPNDRDALDIGARYPAVYSVAGRVLDSKSFKLVRWRRDVPLTVGVAHIDRDSPPTSLKIPVTYKQYLPLNSELETKVYFEGFEDYAITVPGNESREFKMAIPEKMPDGIHRLVVQSMVKDRKYKYIPVLKRAVMHVGVGDNLPERGILIGQLGGKSGDLSLLLLDYTHPGSYVTVEKDYPLEISIPNMKTTYYTTAHCCGKEGSYSLFGAFNRVKEAFMSGPHFSEGSMLGLPVDVRLLDNDGKLMAAASRGFMVGYSLDDRRHTLRALSGVYSKRDQPVQGVEDEQVFVDLADGETRSIRIGCEQHEVMRRGARFYFDREFKDGEMELNYRSAVFAERSILTLHMKYQRMGR
ncbi:hypothetical protein KY363_05380 [Candidatus Woesearchaeota archaeon]|nr:hypothetical protein [Candidatus Woesearchaeota archaeon]